MAKVWILLKFGFLRKSESLDFLRRSRAMHLYLAGVPLPTISEWLGHSNIETTRFYAKVTEEMKRDALHKLSESDKSVVKDDVAFKYAGNEEMLKRLCGLK